MYTQNRTLYTLVKIFICVFNKYLNGNSYRTILNLCWDDTPCLTSSGNVRCSLSAISEEAKRQAKVPPGAYVCRKSARYPRSYKKQTSIILSCSGRTLSLSPSGAMSMPLNMSTTWLHGRLVQWTVLKRKKWIQIFWAYRNNEKLSKLLYGSSIIPEICVKLVTVHNATQFILLIVVILSGFTFVLPSFESINLIIMFFV
jgi:hypothetical protein